MVSRYPTGPATACWLSGPGNDHGHDHNRQAGMTCCLRLAPHDTLLLADTIRRGEHAGTALERALERLGENWARLRVRPESIRAQLLGRRPDRLTAERS